jgi:hypothetical protein
MTALPWSWPVEPPGGWPPGRNVETVTVDAARDGWVEVSVGPCNGHLPPEQARALIAAVEAALTCPHP